MADKNTPVVAFIGLGSMGLGMAKNLLKHGHKVIGVDPSAPAREAFAAAGGTVAATPVEAAASADALVVVTEWKQFRSPDFAKLEKVLKDKVVFDGRNLYDPAEVEAAGLAYYGIGRGRSVRVPE